MNQGGGSGTQLYIAQGERTCGPFPRSEVVKMLETGAIGFEDLGWRCESTGWCRIGDLISEKEVAKARTVAPDGAGGVSILEGIVRSFPAQILLSFAFPLRGNGILVLITAVVAYTFGRLLTVIPILGSALNVMVTAYFTAFFFSIIRSSAMEEDVLPTFPGMEAFWDDVFLPFLRILATFLFYLAPAYAYYLFGQEHLEVERDLGGILAISGLIMVPMALLRLAVFNQLFAALNPFAVLLSLSRMPVSYLVIVGLLIGLYKFWEWGDEYFGRFPWYINLPIFTLFVFYVLAVKARLIGIMYANNKAKLGWFGG